MTKPIAVGVYLYAGGFAVGVNKSFNTVATFQTDNYGMPTFEANFPNTKVYRYKEDWHGAVVSPVLDKVDFLYANPPCAIFSSVGVSRTGVRTDWRTDARTNCWRNIIELVGDIKPTVFAIESVQQAMTKGREFIQEVTDDMMKEGYSVTWVKVNASRMGVAQTRKRFFLVGHKVAINWATPRHAPVTVNEALKEVKDPGRIYERASHRRWLRWVKAGEPAYRWWDRHNAKPKRNELKQPIGRPAFMIRRLYGDRPAGVLFGDMMIHPTENRFLSENEAKALMGIPQSFKIVGGDYHHLITRGVCPPVGAWLGRNVRRALEAGVKQPKTFDVVDFS